MPQAATHFAKEDIGGEILPILTTGLYRDTLDALREYIQNSIDAEAENVSVAIDPSTVVINDDGTGMSGEQAHRSIRLGISDKNPVENIGFRGIGIYSSFNLCNLLDIYTKQHGSRNGWHIVFNFGVIREQLLTEQERRKKGLPPKLYLEKLLQSGVFVEPDTERIISDHGTRVILSDLLPDSYRPLQEWDTVVTYLQDVVPLPFEPQFKYAKIIAKKFEDEDYRVVPLQLRIGERSASLYRPYNNDHFTADGKYPPKFFTLRQGNERFGFAWLCINGRKVLKDEKIRGLLIKKKGFSIGTRGYLEPYFRRPVFNRRITGEIIVEHKGLLPNAARSDFENNSARQRFLELLPTFIQELSQWANTIQQQEKAVEILDWVNDELRKLANRLPSIRRDKEEILKATVSLADYEDSLKTHGKTLAAMDDIKGELKAARELLKESQVFVKGALQMSSERSKRLEQDVVRVVQAEAKSKRSSKKRHIEDPPRDLVSALEASGVPLAADATKAIRLFESEFILEQIDQATYREILAQFVDSLEQGL